MFGCDRDWMTGRSRRGGVGWKFSLFVVAPHVQMCLASAVSSTLKQSDGFYELSLGYYYGEDYTFTLASEFFVSTFFTTTLSDRYFGYCSLDDFSTPAGTTCRIITACESGTLLETDPVNSKSYWQECTLLPACHTLYIYENYPITASARRYTDFSCGWIALTEKTTLYQTIPTNAAFITATDSSATTETTTRSPQPTGSPTSSEADHGSTLTSDTNITGSSHSSHSTGGDLGASSTPSPSSLHSSLHSSLPSPSPSSSLPLPSKIGLGVGLGAGIPLLAVAIFVCLYKSRYRRNKVNEEKGEIFMTPELSHDSYTVGWICALPVEMAAGRTMLDATHPLCRQPSTDHNTYTLGEMNGHNVVITCLPSGVYGTTSAAIVLSQMISTFPRIQFALMVGIGGGAPSTKNDVRLGDVVVSMPTERSGGVVQYDFGQTVYGGRLIPTGFLNNPPEILLTAVSQLRSGEITGSNRFISATLSEVFAQNPQLLAQLGSPGYENDLLFKAHYDHVPSDFNTCLNCDREQLIHRQPRSGTEPRIHYGLVASANQVMRDGLTRDRIAQELGILCFEMEAAGLMNQVPCLVIRGICDYSDSHKNKQWQGYAAVTAAAYGRVLLSVVPPRL